MEVRELQENDVFIIPNRPKICYGFFDSQIFYINKEQKKELPKQTEIPKVANKQEVTQTEGFLEDDDRV